MRTMLPVPALQDLITVETDWSAIVTLHTGKHDLTVFYHRGVYFQMEYSYYLLE